MSFVNFINIILQFRYGFGVSFCFISLLVAKEWGYNLYIYIFSDGRMVVCTKVAAVFRYDIVLCAYGIMVIQNKHVSKISGRRVGINTRYSIYEEEKKTARRLRCHDKRLSKSMPQRYGKLYI